jgi:hypothetical protein
VPAIVESRRERFGRHLITIENGAADSLQPAGLDSDDETRLQTVKPPISIHRCRALAGPEADPWAIPWDVVHRRMPLINRPYIGLMPQMTGLRDVGMEDSDRRVLRVVVKFHPELTTVARSDNDQAHPIVPDAVAAVCGRSSVAFGPKKSNAGINETQYSGHN